jgi:hypothetical protein
VENFIEKEAEKKIHKKKEKSVSPLVSMFLNPS